MFWGEIYKPKHAKYVKSSKCQKDCESVNALICNAPVLDAPVGETIQTWGRCGHKDNVVRTFWFRSGQCVWKEKKKKCFFKNWLCNIYCVYSSSMPVVVITNHNPLTFLISLQGPNQRLIRWALLLQSYSTGQLPNQWKGQCGGECIVSVTLWIMFFIMYLFFSQFCFYCPAGSLSLNQDSVIENGGRGKLKCYCVT